MAALDGFAAVLFDLDGVLTSTAKQHFAAWKETFDQFLRAWSQEHGTAFTPFEQEDYLRHVDGMPRFDGVRKLLSARSIRLPEGNLSDPADAGTVHGLGNRKNDLVNAIIAAEGVEVYDGSVALVRRLRDDGVHTAVVSSSRNCLAVLRAAGIADLFDARVDGEIAADLGLPGKPAPDTFLEAARRLKVGASEAVVVEDAQSGVEAGRAGAFGLVVGVDRVGQAQALRDAGADLVVTDLAQLLPEQDAGG